MKTLNYLVPPAGTWEQHQGTPQGPLQEDLGAREQDAEKAW